MKSYKLSSPCLLFKFCILVFYISSLNALIFTNSAKGEQPELTKVTVFFEGGELAEDVVRFYRYLYNTDPRLLNLRLYSYTEQKNLLPALLDDQIILRGKPKSMIDLLCDLNPQLSCSDIESSKTKTLYVPGIKWKKYTYPQDISVPWKNSKKTGKDLLKIVQNYGASVEDVKQALNVDTDGLAADIDANGDLIYVHNLVSSNRVINATGYRVEISLPSKDVESKDSGLHKIRPNNVFVAQGQESRSDFSTYKVAHQLDKNNCERDYTDILGISATDVVGNIVLNKPTAIAIFEDNIDLVHCDFFDSDGKSIFFHDEPLYKKECNSICDNSNLQLDLSVNHGTHIAGIIGARLNQVGIVGVNPLSHLLALSTGPADIADGITKAIDKGIKVANMSIGYTATGNLQNDIGLKRIKASEEKILFVSAAGNKESNSEDPIYLDSTACGSEVPVCLFMQPNVLTVTALTTSGNEILFNAKRGDGVVHIAAPGENIVSTIPDGGVAKGTGTSQATALVTGTASLLFSLNPSLSPEAVKNRIMYTADLLPELNNYVKSGRLNIKRAIENIDEDIVIYKESIEPHFGCIETVTKNFLFIYSEDFDQEAGTGEYFPLKPRNIRRIVWIPGSDNYTFMVYEENEPHKRSNKKSLKRYSGYRFQPKNVTVDNLYQDVSKHFVFNSCDSTSPGEPINLVDVKDLIMQINR